jgi:DNA-binding NarL/FixJ family response regulator
VAIVVAVAGAGDILTEGLWHILGQAPDLEVMRDYSLRFPHVGVLPDVVLLDALAVLGDDGAKVRELVDAHEAAVLVVGRDLRPGLAARALACGAAGCVSMEAPTAEILATIREAAGGELQSGTPALGGEAGLSEREAKILSDIVKGFANTDIALRQSLTINTIKSYIRATYRKIGVTTRAQAVSWALQHGFEPQDHAEPDPRTGRTVLHEGFPRSSF